MMIDRLPHRPPFLFVTEVVCADPAAFEAAWHVEGSEEFLRGHFPGNPIVPGVLIVEALAQVAGLQLISRGGDDPHVGMLVQSEIRFRKPVRPPARIALNVSQDGGLGALHRFAVRASVDGHTVADGSLVLVIAARGAATS